MVATPVALTQMSEQMTAQEQRDAINANMRTIGTVLTELQQEAARVSEELGAQGGRIASLQLSIKCYKFL